jgi:ferrochelatase
MGFDAVLLVSFGGPERREDVLPFLDNVLHGKPVPEARKLEVAEHYYHFGGRSPIAAATRAMAAALERELAASALPLPVYQGNRNWHPLLPETLERMRGDGRRHALAIATSAFGSYSGCRQYREDIDRARAEVGAGAPAVDMLPPFGLRPEFAAIWAERVRAALAQHPRAALLFTAHSIPLSMARTSPYERQLNTVCARVAAAAGADGYRLAYQSRSGPPAQPWLEPSLDSVLEEVARAGASAVVVAPVGFLSDHMEVVYDLDLEARARAEALGLAWSRVATPGDHPRFAALLRALVAERAAQPAAGADACAAGCCALSSDSPSHRATAAAARQLPSRFTAVRPISKN